MTALGNGVSNSMEEKNYFTNGNINDRNENDCSHTNATGKNLIMREHFSMYSINNPNDINSISSDSGSNGAVIYSNHSCDSKSSGKSNTKLEIHGNNSCVTSEGYSTGHEDFSGFEGAPVSIEVAGVTKETTSDDDEYFEEFHLPNTYENAFVRHQSFRKKVKLTPIHAPDAEHIEGLVRTGYFHRHNSVRRKILHEEQESDFDDSDSLSSSLSEQLRQDIEEIEKIVTSESQSCIKECSNAPVTHSTPKNDTPKELVNNEDVSTADLTEESSLSVELNTLKKIKDCLDVTKHKSIYHLSGRLQDILSPQEIEEVLNNSGKYSSLLTAEVLEALSMSLHENTMSNEESEKQDLTNAKFSSKSEEVYKSCESSLDLKVIEAPKLDLGSLDDSGSICISDVETQNTSELLSSFDLLSESYDRTKYQRRISVDGVSFTSASCYSAPSNSSDQQMSPEAPSLLCYPSPFSNPNTDLSPLPPPPDLIRETDDALEENHWRNVVIAGDWKRIDMKAVNPYKSFISHGGFSEAGSQVIVISASLLPKRCLKEYNYIMDNLFMYSLSLLEQLVAEDYIIIYFAGGRATSGPGLHWMRKAYDIIDRRIRKNMKQLLIVHPSLWARTLVVLAKPFISSKFYRKLRFVYSLTDLAQIVALSSIQIPETIKQLDFELMINEKKRAKHTR